MVEVEFKNKKESVVLELRVTDGNKCSVIRILLDVDESTTIGSLGMNRSCQSFIKRRTLKAQ